MEVYYNGEWGTINDFRWGLNDAQVVCKEVGYGNATNATYNAFYGQGRGSVLFSTVECIGTEKTIGNCSRKGSSCGSCHENDAGVKCNSGKLRIITCLK